MRRFLCGFGLGVTLLGFSGCWGNSDEGDSSTEYEIVTLEGTLQSLSNAAVADNVTHLFRAEDDTIYYVYSEKVDLFDLQWVNESVEVTGDLIPGEEEGGKDVIRIETVVLAEESEEDAEPVEMVLYENTTLGFSIQYRSDWRLEEAPSMVVFHAPEVTDLEASIEDTESSPVEEFRDSISISRRDNLQALPIEEWFVTYGTTETTAPYLVSAVGPEQIPAIKVDDVDATSYYVSDGDQVLVLLFESVQPAELTEHTRLFNEMIYSLNFLSDDEEFPSGSSDEMEETSEQETLELSETHTDVMERLEKELDGLVETSGTWSPLQYAFVDPNTVYVEYQEVSTGTNGRLLLSYTESLNFSVLAVFEPGEFTDWELVSGEDVSKGQEALEVNASTGSASVIPEGYRSMESSSMSFQIAYPAAWYYSRSGNFYYYSDKPAEASNALATLELVDGQAESDDNTDGDRFVITLPRDEAHHFLLYGSVDLKEILQKMAQSFTVLP